MEADFLCVCVCVQREGYRSASWYMTCALLQRMLCSLLNESSESSYRRSFLLQTPTDTHPHVVSVGYTA